MSKKKLCTLVRSQNYLPFITIFVSILIDTFVAAIRNALLVVFF